MSSYLIHACPDRMWYVNEYIIPSMQAQGITNIDVKCDDDGLGCLENCMKIFGEMPDDDDGTWHLQDDIIICHDFKERTEQFDESIVCGYVYTRNMKFGLVKPDKMWWSFPCIRIPNRIARECSRWYYDFAKGFWKYWEWVDMKKCDDNMFREFMITHYPYYDVLNLAPNLVDHVDYLIGGSVVNRIRGNEQYRAQYFEDGYLVDELEKSLGGRNHE